MAHPKRQLPDKICVICGNIFNRKMFGKRLEDASRFLSRKTCSQSCGNSKINPTIAGYRWRAKKLRKGVCEHCNTTVSLHTHHKDGDVTNNTLVNIATLCASCHLKLHWRQNPSFGVGKRRRLEITESNG